MCRQFSTGSVFAISVYYELLLVCRFSVCDFCMSHRLSAGSLFAMMHCGESITYFLAPFAFSAIYASTLHYYGGLVFIVAFLLLVLPVGFT